ncbi:MAG: PKD domain-containing protein, partial [bacterium]
ETRGPFKCVKLARFVDQISITDGTFSDGGDSGSLIVTDDSNKKPVGLLYAGSSDRTLANPIDPVLQRFNVTIDDGSGGGNMAPTADFTYTTSDLTVTFTDQSDDPDGSIVSWDWNFDDGGTSTEQNPTHTYASAGTYSVTLTVTDNESATDAISKDVTVSTGGGGISLTATGYKVRGRQKADLEWSGASGAFVDVYRDGVKITTTENDGFYTDNIDNVGGGSYTYQIFDGTTWSNEATVTF